MNGIENAGTRLKKLRIKHGYTQSDVAEFLGISQSQMAKVESNKRHLKLTKILKLCDLYNVTEEYILYGEGKDTNTLYFTKQKGLSLECLSRMNKIVKNLQEMSELETQSYVETNK